MGAWANREPKTKTYVLCKLEFRNEAFFVVPYIRGSQRAHKHQDPTFWLEVPYKVDSRSHRFVLTLT